MIPAMATQVGPDVRAVGERPDAPAQSGRAELRWAAWRLVALFLVARLLVVGCAMAVEGLAPVDATGPGGSTLQATTRPLLASLTSWDAVYYLDIASDGYRAGPVNGPYPDVVFFPLYPVAVGATATLLGGDIALSGVLVANLAGLAALGAVYLLARRRLERDGAFLATTLVALGPGAVAFSMAYSDSLFLLLVAGSLLAAERDARPLSGALACLAALTRLQGALLILPLLVLFWQRDGRRPRASWLWALGAPAGLAMVCLAIGRVTGDVLTPIREQGIWDFGGVPSAVAEPWVVVVAALAYGATSIVTLKLLFDRWRARRDPSGVGWGAANVLAILATRRVASIPRYLAPVTQAAEQLVGGAYRPAVVRAVLAVSAGSYVVLAILHFSLKLAP